MRRSLIALAVLASLAGCAFDGQLQNRITTTLDCKRAFVASLYGPVGLTAEINGADVLELPCHKKPAQPSDPLVAPQGGATPSLQQNAVPLLWRPNGSVLQVVPAPYLGNRSP